METNEEATMEGFLGTILPPSLENAGLEDCALPLQSIMEAFSLAASSLKFRVSFNQEDDGCVQDPGPSNGQIPDKLLGAIETCPSPPQPSCGGSGDEIVGNEDVVVFGGVGLNAAADRVLIVGERDDGSEYVFGGDRGCTVAGGILPGEKNGYGDCGEEVNEDGEVVDGPILIEELI